MTECDWAQQRIHELLVGVLARRARGRLARHLATCHRCREYLREARHLPGLLASFGAPDAPEGLADYIKGACFFSVGMEPAERRRQPTALQTSMAAAAAAVLLVVLGLTHLPGLPNFSLPPRHGVAISLASSRAPQLSAGRDIALALAPDHDVHVQSPSSFVREEEPSDLQEQSSGPTVNDSTVAATTGKPSAHVPPSPRFSQRQAHSSPSRAGARVNHRVRTRPRLAKTRPVPMAASSPRRRGAPAGVTSPARPAPSLAFAPGTVAQMAPAGHVALAEAPGTGSTRIAMSRPQTVRPSERMDVGKEKASDDDEATKVTNNLAAGLIAGALMERYVADAVAEQGAQLVTATVAADATQPATTNETVAHDDFSDL
ncbi:MAG: hypothetical protein J7M26_00090 [Armatimonadetes bacterium]|nr:hypothetical protein [Armatimonadota bacterium]